MNQYCILKVYPIFFLIGLTFVSCKGIKQCNYILDYHPKIISAEISYEIGAFKKAYNYYREVFDKCPCRNTSTYYEITKMAKVCAKLNLTDEAIAMIETQISNGFLLSGFLDDDIFKEVFKSNQGIQLIERYDSLRNQFLDGVDKALVEKLHLMKQKDQKYRGNGTYRENKIEQELLDAENEKKLIEIFETSGYPGDHLIRYGNYVSGFFLGGIEPILLHTNDSIRVSYFLPKIKEFIEKGQCNPRIYGEMYDQLLIYSGKPQAYGTYTTNRKGNLSESIDLRLVDKNRIAIGLPLLEDKKLIDQLRLKNYPNIYGKIFSN